MDPVSDNQPESRVSGDENLSSHRSVVSNSDRPESPIDDADGSSRQSASSSSLPSEPTSACNDLEPGPSLIPADMDLSLLPPLPTPDYNAKRREMTGGIALVNILILTFVGLTHGVALTAVHGIEKETRAWWVFLILIYSCAIAALVSLVGLLLTDPRVVRRSAERCFPVPAPADAWVASFVEHQKLKDNKEDIDDKNLQPPKEVYIPSPDGNGDSYCVRCLVWRRNRPGVKYFHCTTCQRCVHHFNHHCSFFGRCIAGRGVQGNLKYFMAIIACGGLAYFVTVIALIWSLSIRFGAKWAVPISFVVLWIVQANMLNKSPGAAMCVSCRNIAVMFVECVHRCFQTKNRSAAVQRPTESRGESSREISV